jgi:hypothetical protein
VRVGLLEARSPFTRPAYADYAPLLAAMAQVLGDAADRIAALRPLVAAHALPLFDDIAGAARMTALRAAQVDASYAAVAGPAAQRSARLADALAVIQQAAGVMKTREAAYRVPLERIGAWRPNPTCYNYTYLWTAHRHVIVARG